MKFALVPSCPWKLSSKMVLILGKPLQDRVAKHPSSRNIWKCHLSHHRQEVEKRRREVILDITFIGKVSGSCVLQLPKIAPPRNKQCIHPWRTLHYTTITDYAREKRTKTDLCYLHFLKDSPVFAIFKAWAVVCLSKGNRKINKRLLLLLKPSL